MANEAPAVFIGSVKLCMRPFTLENSIAQGFENSTRKMLKFVKQDVQNGEVVVRSSLDMTIQGSHHWQATGVGYFLGKRPYYHYLNTYVRSVWNSVKDVAAPSHCTYFFMFKSEVAMENVIEGGLWLFQG